MEIAFLWEPALFTPEKKGRFLFESLLNEFQELKVKVADAPEASKAGAVGPLATQSRQPSGTRFLLVGDALGYVDGITGEGISVALEQAERVGSMLPSVLAQGDCSQTALARLGGLYGRASTRLFFWFEVPFFLADIALAAQVGRAWIVAVAASLHSLS